MKATHKVEGLRELDAALGELPRATGRNVLRRVGLKALQPVANSARDRAPDDPNTGGKDLRNSIGVGTRLSARQAKLNRKAIKAGEERSFIEIYAGAGPLPQAHLQEFGTVHHPPQPFMRPAWDENKDQVLDTVKTDLWAEIEKAARRHAKKAARDARKAAG